MCEAAVDSRVRSPLPRARQLGTATAGTADLPAAPAGLLVSIAPRAGGAEVTAGESRCGTCGARCSALCEMLAAHRWRCNFCGGENESAEEVRDPRWRRGSAPPGRGALRLPRGRCVRRR